MPNPALEKQSRAKQLAFRSIQADLTAQDSNIRQFAIEHEYDPGTVRLTLLTYAGTRQMPRSRKRMKILLQVSRLIGREIVPGLFTAAREDAA